MRQSLHRPVLAAAFVVVAVVYWPGLSGGYLFDDYPNIVDNASVHPQDISLPSLIRAALSSPSSQFKRPLASLTFAANFVATGLDPYWMKMTNLVIHLLNGMLVYLLARALLSPSATGPHSVDNGPSSVRPVPTIHTSTVATLIAVGWMLLPINLTGMLYVVQRMESIANLFVLLGLLGYVHGRRRMLSAPKCSLPDGGLAAVRRESSGLLLCVFSIIVPSALGLLAKETAVMLPLYAVLVEWALFRLHTPAGQTDRRLLTLFIVVLVLPMMLGLAWLAPKLGSTGYWATRDFTLTTRLLSEARIICDYIVWTLLPTPNALSFYHDDFIISTGLLSPWTTLASILFLSGLTASGWRLRARQPLAALGIALFLGCHLLTGTVLPLELIYEHRNYFASFGLLLATIPFLAAPPSLAGLALAAKKGNHRGFVPPPSSLIYGSASAVPMALPRYVLLAGLMLLWTGLTAVTAHAWGNPLRLAEELAARAPQSPRAQYELGRTYIIYSRYDPTSPFTRMAYAPLERAAALPESSILPEQALIFMNSRMHKPLKDAWWKSLTEKLKTRRPGVQDESSLGALTQCVREHGCDLPKQRMVGAFAAALEWPNPSARLLATYSDYAWNVLDDRELGERMAADAVRSAPDEPAYHVTLARMYATQGRFRDARQQIERLRDLNVGGRLDTDIAGLSTLIPVQ